VANTPKQIVLYRALGYDLPEFAHVPMILGKDKQKLSKRHGAASITEFRDEGYLPVAVRLCLAKLGWTPKVDGKAAESVEEELLTDQQLMENFDLGEIQKAAAVFDLDKLTWLNQKFIQRLDWTEIAPHLRWQWQMRGFAEAWDARPDEWKALAIGCNKNRTTLKDMANTIAFLFQAPEVFEEAPVARFMTAAVKPALREVMGLEDYGHDALKAGIDAILARHGFKLKDLAQALRVAFTGGVVSPPIFDTMALLGRAEVCARLERWI
jgi:glutamyl-tRNA synthetase